MNMRLILLFVFIVPLFGVPHESDVICNIKSNNPNLNWPTDDETCSNLCEYIGISCENEYITNITLREKNLNGTILAQLGTLQYLTVLDLVSNNLEGNIPTELCNISQLAFLALSDNKLTGPIPMEIKWLTQLTALHLEKNKLTGAIPTEIGFLTTLNYLDLQYNYFTGTIPTEFGYLKILFNIGLNDNGFTGTIPTEFGNSSDIFNLVLNNNNLTGTIPTELAKLTRLENLFLSNNQLSGTVPEELYDLPNLVIIDFGTQRIPPSNSLEVDQDLNLNDGVFVYEKVIISNGSILVTRNVDLAITSLSLSDNSTLSVSNSTIHVQESITIPSGFTLTITNPTTTILETQGGMVIQPNTTLNIIFGTNFTQTNQNMTLISFKSVTGSFTNIHVDNECVLPVEKSTTILLVPNPSLKCSPHQSSSSQKSYIISVLAIIMFIFFVVLN